MLLFPKADLSQSDLDVAADLAENGSDAASKARKLVLANQLGDYPKVIYNGDGLAVTLHEPWHINDMSALKIS